MAAPFVAPNFNPLHREGGDRYILRTQSGQPRFQSTPPRGWRHQFIIDWIAANEFQSTPPRGWRHNSTAGYWCIMSLFQSTPPRGWRLILHGHIIVIGMISIHSTARVETMLRVAKDTDILFQSTPPRGWRRGPLPCR
mgnify:CR=1 FL=1